MAWNAAVMADFLGEQTWIERLDDEDGTLRALVLAKRQRFPGDPRLIVELKVRKSKANPSCASSPRCRLATRSEACRVDSLWSGVLGSCVSFDLPG